MKIKDFWHICIYLIFYSFVGLIMETIFGLFSKGVIESRRSFLYGPFCAIYGIGATLMILFLNNEKNVWKIFGIGAIIGAVSEYLMSFLCEKIIGLKWWDYSNYILNVNGRTCLAFAILWGLLAILLIKIVNPNLNKIIDFFNKKKIAFQTITVLLVYFYAFDALMAGYALKVFYYRVAVEKNLNIENKQEIENRYLKIKNNKDLDNFITMYFGNEKMIENYPNMMIQDKDDNLIYIDSLYKV